MPHNALQPLAHLPLKKMLRPLLFLLLAGTVLPAPAQPPHTGKQGCWVSIFAEEDYRGARAQLAGPTYVEHLPHFAGAPIYDGPFPVGRLHGEGFEPVIERVELPTIDMLRRALPEGVLHPGGRVTGFLYFERVGPQAERVRLLADFPDVQTGKRITRLGIPFLVGQ